LTEDQLLTSMINNDENQLMGLDTQHKVKDPVWWKIKLHTAYKWKSLKHSTICPIDYCTRVWSGYTWTIAA